MHDRRFTKLLMTAAVWLLSLFAPLAAEAQTKEAVAIPPGPLTLEQVLSLAEPKSEAVSIAVAGVRRAEGARRFDHGSLG